MIIDNLLTDFKAKHWQFLTDDATLALHQFVEHIREALEPALSGKPEAPAEDGMAMSEGLTQTECGTKVYTDGTTVTGTLPLPELSPAQQDAAGGEPAPVEPVAADAAPEATA